MTHGWTLEAANAAKRPPDCLKPFAVSAIPPSGERQPCNTVDFRLACETCGGTSFRIFGFLKTAPDPSPYAGLAPGETLFRPPHGLCCSSCGRRAELFDARKNGYDGVLNGGCAYESGEAEASPLPGTFSVVVSIAFNTTDAELSELAAEAGVHPSDLFDWITIAGTPTDAGSPVQIDYECA